LSPSPDRAGAPSPAGGTAAAAGEPGAGRAGAPRFEGEAREGALPGAAARGGARERPGAALLARRFGAVVLLVALDLWSKARVFAWLESSAPLVPDACQLPHRRFLLVGEWLALMLSRNKGAAFGQLDSVPYLLVGGRVLAVLFLVYLILRAAPGRRVLNTALVLVLAGAAGNLVDNLLLPPPPYDAEHPFGYVRDFIDVYFVGWRWHFPTFNVADSCITVGAVLLLASGFRRDAQREPAV
jgi:signal peptidase II